MDNQTISEISENKEKESDTSMSNICDLFDTIPDTNINVKIPDIYTLIGTRGCDIKGTSLPPKIVISPWMNSKIEPENIGNQELSENKEKKSDIQIPNNYDWFDIKPNTNIENQEIS